MTTAAVTPELIYEKMLAAGATSTEAIGILANMQNESSFNPEMNVIDSNGLPSVGLVSWNNNPTAERLVTGNPAADMASQVGLLASTGAFAQASGSTPQQAAVNFAHNFEVCTACGYNGDSTQLAARAGNATYWQQAAASGKWPSGSGAPGAAVTTATSHPSGSSGGGSGSINILSTPIGGIGIPSGIVIRGVLLVVGVFLAYSATKSLFGVGGSSNQGPAQIVASGARSAGNTAKKTGEMAAAVAA